MIAGGIAVALAAALANAFAIVLQAGEDRQTPLSQGGRLSLLIRLAHRRRWLAGIALLIVAWPLQVLALGLAPLAVVQPLLAATQLVLLAVARIKLNEQVGWIEALGAACTVAGISVVVWAAPHHTVHHLTAARVAPPMAVIGGAAILSYLVWRVRAGFELALIVGAGLAYAWVDFTNKLLAAQISRAAWGWAALCLIAILAFGALAFLEETTALQRRPAVTVAPVMGAVHDPLPVLMALWSGIEVWGAATHRVAPLLGGLALIALGAWTLGRSTAVARVSGEPEPAARRGSRRRSLAAAFRRQLTAGHDVDRLGQRGADGGRMILSGQRPAELYEGDAPE